MSSRTTKLHSLSGKQIGVFYNPTAGRGQGKIIAERIALFLRERQAVVTLKETLNAVINPVGSPLSELCLDAAVLVGGDGTLMSLLPLLTTLRIPIYLAPSGNESLFAREFGMTSNERDVASALAEGDIREYYIASANQTLFFTMASVGFDSAVVKALSETRSGSIGHRGYLIPTLRELVCHRPPKITLFVDGKQVISQQPGFLIVANSKQYALRMNFVPEAQTTDRLLRARFFPYSSLWKYFFYCLRCMCSSRISDPDVLFFEGAAFRVEVAEIPAYPAQADGDYVGNTPLTISALDKTLRVIHPPT